MQISKTAIHSCTFLGPNKNVLLSTADILFVADKDLTIIRTLNLCDSEFPTGDESHYRPSLGTVTERILFYNAFQIVVKCFLKLKTIEVLRAQDIRDQFVSQPEKHIFMNAFSNEKMSPTTISLDEPIVGAGFALEGTELYVGFGDSVMLFRQKSHERYQLAKCVLFPQMDEIVGLGVIGRSYFIHSKDKVVIFNPENERFKVVFSGSAIRNVVTTSTTSGVGTKLAVLLRCGECLIFEAFQSLFSIASNDPLCSNKHIELTQLQEKIAQTIPRLRLMAILQEFHEFPQKHRPIIWKSILEIAENHTDFDKLIKQPTHPCTKLYPKVFPLSDHQMARNLSRVVSCLAYWCPALALTEFTPLFVFPFLNVFGSNLLLCFETVATILLNCGQLWFEFAPLEPINYLGLVDNLLDHVDPQLMKFYRSKKVTSSIYAFALIQSAFTEILTTDQWLSFWDHVLMQPPYFLIFCLVTLNVSLRTNIMHLNNASDIELFFAERNSTIDTNLIINHACSLMETCPSELHPRPYFHPHRSLGMVHYQPSFAFPRRLIANTAILNLPSSCSTSLAQIQAVRKVNDKLVELEQMKQSIEILFADNKSNRREHEKRLKMVEDAYAEGVRYVELLNV